MQYTIRGVPPAVDAALRERARQTGKSLNEAALDALAEGTGVTGAPRKRRDLSDLIDSWKPDQEFLDAIDDQRRIDQDLWK